MALVGSTCEACQPIWSPCGVRVSITSIVCCSDQPAMAAELRIIVTVVLLAATEGSLNQEVRLWEDLISKRGLDTQSRPVQSHDDSLEVQVGLDISHIIGLDEKSETLSLNAWMKFCWNDFNLTWNPANYGGIDLIQVPDKSIWQPDITLYNSARASDIDHYGHTMAQVYSSGLVLWIPPVTLHSICPMDLRRYPFDEHVCALRFGSWSYDSLKINLTLFDMEKPDDKVNLSTNLFDEHNEWELVSTNANRSVIHDACCPHFQPTVQFFLHLRRRAPYYKLSILVPTFMTMAVTLSLFWLPPTAGEKITLGGFNCLIIMLLLNHISSTLPNNGSKVSSIVLICGNSMIFAGLSLILSVFTIRISRCHRHTAAPSFLRDLLSGWMGKILCLGSVKANVPVDAKLLTSGNVELALDKSDPAMVEQDKANHRNDWLLVATALDRIFFLLYCLSFGIILSSSY